MASAKICSDGFTVNVIDGDVNHIEIVKEDQVVATFECEIDQLKTVGKGLTYQCVDRDGSVTVQREDDSIIIAIAAEGIPKHKCRVPLVEFNDALDKAKQRI